MPNICIKDVINKMLEDLRITNEEITQYEAENKVLSNNRETNRVQIYMHEQISLKFKMAFYSTYMYVRTSQYMFSVHIP